MQTLPILVIGSVHIDIIADVDPLTSDNLDRTGKLVYSVGGTAFNISANLAHHHHPVILYSFVKRDGFGTPMIQRELSIRGINALWIHYDQTLSESAFIAQILNGAIITAVSCICIEHVDLDDTDLVEAIAQSSMVAVECNLSLPQIQKILSHANFQRRPVAICAVSDSKVSRIFRHFSENKPDFCLVTLNEREAQRVLGVGPLDATYVCESFSAEHVVLTQGSNGYTLFRRDGFSIAFASPKVDLVSTLGAGDALFGALCAHLSARASIDIATIQRDVSDYLIPVLRARSALP